MDSGGLYKQIKTLDASHINEESVFPCITKKEAKYLHPSIEGNMELEDLIKNNLLTIVTKPGVDSIVQSSRQDQLEVLCSLRENGRVLESNDRVHLDGVRYKMMIKGVGATTYYRKTGAKNPRMRRNLFTHEEWEKSLLECFPFLDRGGILPLSSALIEKEKVDEMNKLGIDTEKVLAIYELESVLGPDGAYHDIKTLQDDGVISPESSPCLLIRAQKSNIRLMDIILLERMNKEDLLSPIMNEVMKEAKEHMGIDSMQEYLEYLVRKVIKQRCSLQHYSTRNGERWQDIIRNITVLGEEVDLVTMKLDIGNYHQESPYSFIDRYKRIISEIMIGLTHFIDLLQEHYKDQIDLPSIALLIVDEINSFVLGNMGHFLDIYEKKGYYKRYFVEESSQGIHKFQNHLVQKMYSFNTDYCVLRDLDKEIRNILIEKGIYEER